MAKMFPPHVSPNTQSGAEKRLFDTIRTQLSDEWTALHSLGLANHRSKPWAELDFVLIGPPGIFCLEVKGGRVARTNGEWLFTNRNDRTSAKREGPYQQVGSGAAALKHHLFAQLPTTRSVIVGEGVVFPDIVFDETGPDINPRITYDLRDREAPFSKYMDRLVGYWRERLMAQGRYILGDVPAPDRAAIRDELRGDFDLRPSLRTRIGLVKEELLRLTNEQFRILDGLIENERVIVQGGAGTGKTLLAVEEGRRRAEEGARVLYSCYNKNLASYVRAAVTDRPRIDVFHLHGLMADAVRQADLRSSLPQHSDDLFTELYPRACIEALEKLDRIGVYDVLIIDEAQDLVRDSYLDVFDILLDGGLTNGSWRAFLDPFQDIFSGTEEHALQRLRSASATRFRLSLNCRNTDDIAVNTALLSTIQYERTRDVTGPEVEYRWYRDAADQIREISKCVNRLLSDGIKPSEIAILSRRRREAGVARAGLERVAFPLVDIGETLTASDARAIPYSTIAGYKGLEADAVLVIDIDDLENPDALRTLYVGASRARSYLAVFIDQSQKARYEEHCREFGARLASIDVSGVT